MVRRLVMSIAAAAGLVVAGGRQAPQASAPERAAPVWSDLAGIDELEAEDCVDGSNVMPMNRSV